MASLTLLTTLAALLVFASAAFVVILVDEQSELEHESAPDVEAPSWEAGREVLSAMAIALPFGLAAAFCAALWAGRRIAAPIDEVARAAEATSAETLGQRLPVPDRDDEVRALVVAQNTLFERLQNSFETIQRFAADASHELRTPLTVIRTDLEVSLRRPRTSDEWAGAARRTLEEVHRLEMLVTSLLQLARADALPRAGVCDVGDAVSAVASRMDETGKLRTVTAEEVPLVAAIPRDVMELVLSNLVSNALRHATSVVELRVAARGDDVSVQVDDDGPGVPDDRLARIFEPFQGRREEGSVGLGLSIASRAAHKFGGRIEVGRSELGGARFSLAVPAASPSTSGLDALC